MTNVVRFSPAKSARRAVLGDRGGAQILFFTGVRYQRWTDETPSQAKSARRKRERVEVGLTTRGRKSQR